MNSLFYCIIHNPRLFSLDTMTIALGLGLGLGLAPSSYVFIVFQALILSRNRHSAVLHVYRNYELIFVDNIGTDSQFKWIYIDIPTECATQR